MIDPCTSFETVLRFPCGVIDLTTLRPWFPSLGQSPNARDMKYP